MNFSKIILALLIFTSSGLYASMYADIESWGLESKICVDGNQQSPINLPSMSKDNKPLGSLSMNYKNVRADKLTYKPYTAYISFKKGSDIVLAGHSYHLVQLHFHSPSEHTINNRNFPMEAHFVNQDDAQNVSVVGIFFTIGKKNNPTFESILSLLETAKKSEDKKTDYIGGFNINDLIPKNSNYYKYQGSLTTPPCSENVLWNVLSTPVEISQEQMNRYHNLVNEGTNRPIQEKNERVVQEKSL